MKTRWFLVVAAGLSIAGCTVIPSGPSVMVLPGDGKDFDRFAYDDAICRQWADQQIGKSPSQAAHEAGVGGAAIGTAVGAATGAAIGAAYGDPGTGAAVGAGVGLLGGTAVGADAAANASWALQRRYDIAYMQCMYAKGHQIPVPRGYQRHEVPASSGPATSVPPPADIPPPPRGSPPPPPPGY